MSSPKRLLASILALAFALAGCVSASPAPSAPPARGLVRKDTPEEVNIAKARARGRQRAFTWEPYGPLAFERAKRERKFILLDGAAEWCHWCHVMDETTYLDPDIGRALSERFVAIRVDIDEHPDIGERYGAWGWPATILFSPDAEELGKYRGYIPAEELKGILRDIASAKKDTAEGSPGLGALPLPVEALGWLSALETVELDGYYDEAQGGWGQRQKAPLGANIEFEWTRASRGDLAAKQRAIFTLQKQRALIDPVWGGIYQYSAGADWNAPHYEKLMTYQAANLEAYAKGYAATKDASLLADAQKIARYMSTFLSNEGGAFLVSQDADVNAHQKEAAFVDGDVYYRLPDQERRKLGIPRVDEHVYAHENGLAVSAFVTLYEASRDPAILARARRAADLVLTTLVDPDGAVRRGTQGVRYLADAASFGRALSRLAEVTGEASYRAAAVKVNAAMERDLADPATGAFWAHTPDPAAAGVFRTRERPFVHNVTAARFLSALARVTGDQATRERARRVLAGVLTPSEISGRGRMVGDLLLALSEAGVYPWAGLSTTSPKP